MGKIPAFVSRMATASLGGLCQSGENICRLPEGDSPPAVTFIEPSVKEHPQRAKLWQHVVTT